MLLEQVVGRIGRLEPLGTESKVTNGLLSILKSSISKISFPNLNYIVFLKLAIC